MRVKLLSAAIVMLPAVLPAPQAATATAWEKSIAPGLVYRMEYDPRIPRQLHALRLSPSSPALRWYPELAGGTIEEESSFKGRLTPTEMATQTRAIASVNGDFFSFDHGSPIGMTVKEGELLNTPARARAIFAWGPKDAMFALGDAKVTATTPNGLAVPLDGMNQPISANGIGLYTATQGRLTPREGSVVILLDAPNVVWAPSTEVMGTVVSLSSDTTPFTVAPGRAVLVAVGAKKDLLKGLAPGNTVSIRIETPGFDWLKYENAIGGGPFLLRKGEVDIDAVAEGFGAAFAEKRHPRTAIGETADGDIWIVTIDGRQETGDGATLKEMALVMRRLGCVDAMNLDGGGSTALHIRSLTVNRPSDGRERAVSNGIVVLGPRPQTPIGKLRLVTDARVRKDGTLDAHVELDGKPVDNIEVLWTARGTAWADPGGRVHFTKPGPATLYADAYGQSLQAELEWKGRTK